jgi:hypothetical protein
MLPIPALIGILAAVAPSVYKKLTGDGEKDKNILEHVADIAKDVTGLDSINDAVIAIQGKNETLRAFQIAVMDNEAKLIELAYKDTESAHLWHIWTAKTKRN